MTSTASTAGFNEVAVSKFLISVEDAEEYKSKQKLQCKLSGVSMNPNSKFVLFPCTLLNDTASNLDYTVSNDW